MLSKQGSMWRGHAVGVALVALAIGGAANADIFWYVDADNVSCEGDGLTWGTAFCTLQDALAVAGDGDEIHVAQSTYYPDRTGDDPNGTGDRLATFQLINGVRMLGGFAGPGHEDPDERDPDLYPTILSGDLAGDDEPGFVNYEENSRHVVTGSGTDATAIIEGFTVTSGHADGPGWPETGAVGAGLLIDTGSPQIRRCRFTANIAVEAGGGLLSGISSSPSVDECVFDQNAARFGGGSYFVQSSATVSRCTVENNTAIEGAGGLGFWECTDVSVADCVVSNNTSEGVGGGLGFWDSSNVTVRSCRFEENIASLEQPFWAGGALQLATCDGVTIIDCRFERNQAGWGAGLACGWDCTDVTVLGSRFFGNIAAGSGGGMAVQDAAPTVINTLFADNTAPNYGGGLHTWTAGHPTLINATFVGNTADFGGGVHNREVHGVAIHNGILWDNEPTQIYGATPLVVFSDVEGGWSGVGNIDLDPMLDAEFRPLPGSPVIDAAANNAVPVDAFDLDADTDIDERVPVDLGDDPRFADDLDTSDTGCGAPVQIDMGAYEYQGAPWHPMLVGDVDGDGIVGFDDLLKVLSTWGACDPECCPADIDFSWEVNFDDLLIVLSNWS